MKTHRRLTRPFFLLALLFTTLPSLHAYEDAFLGLPFASLGTDSKFRGDLEIAHRFYDLTKGSGLNADLKISAVFLHNIFNEYRYTTGAKELGAGLGGWFGLGPLQLGLFTEGYTSFKTDVGLLKWQSEAFVQGPALGEVLVPLLSAHYDAAAGRLGLATGLHWKVLSDWSLILEGGPNSNFSAWGYTVGIWHKTLGHQFVLTIGNLAGFDQRALTSGQPKPDEIFLGFVLRRKHDFYWFDDGFGELK